MATDSFQDTTENFITAHIEAAAEYKPTKPRAKCRVSWESITVREKWDYTKKSLLNKGNLTNSSVQELEKVLRELTHTKKDNQNTFMAKSIKSEILLKKGNHAKHGKQ